MEAAPLGQRKAVYPDAECALAVLSKCADRIQQHWAEELPSSDDNDTPPPPPAGAVVESAPDLASPPRKYRRQRRSPQSSPESLENVAADHVGDMQDMLDYDELDDIAAHF